MYGNLCTFIQDLLHRSDLHIFDLIRVSLNVAATSPPWSNFFRNLKGVMILHS